MNQPIRILADRSFATMSINLYANATGWSALPLAFKKRPENTAAEPFARLDEQTAQELMDSLWSAGVRPAQGSGSAGSLAATERHLEDMRALVFKLQKPKLKTLDSR